jgi:mono/diheme cytochrome c family protein
MKNSQFRYKKLIASIFVFLVSAIIWAFPVHAQEVVDEEKLELGSRLYAENCAVCHGADGQGRVGATLNQDWPSIRPDLRIQETIANGVSGTPMVAWSTENGGPLSGEEIDALVYFILNWETGGPIRIYPTLTPFVLPALTAPPGIAGDPTEGANLYLQNCAVCHGENGEGRIGATLARDWPSIRPDLRVKSVIVDGVEGSPMPAWSQENGGPLTEEEIDNIVAYVLTWSGATGAQSPVETPRIQEDLSSPWWLWVLVFAVFIGLIIAIVVGSGRGKSTD